MREALEAVTSWRERRAPLGELASLVRALEASPSDVLECVKVALDDDAKGRAPPIHKAHLFRSRDDAELADKLGTASRVLGAIHRALTSTTPVATRVEERDEERVLIVTAPRDELTAAVRRDGAVIVMDAGADLHLPILAKVVGYAPRFHRVTAIDGAPIECTLHPETNRIFVYCLAYAAKQTGVEIHGLVVMSNHWHGVISDPEARLPEFLQILHRLVAAATNALLGHVENLWAAEARALSSSIIRTTCSRSWPI